MTVVLIPISLHTEGSLDAYSTSPQLAPDISFATQQLSQFLSQPTNAHFKVALRVLRYLKGCHGQGLFFLYSSSIQLLGFNDTDWGGCLDTRHSVTGFCFFLSNSLISWKSKKQVTVARSSPEAEYRALAAASCELQWLNFLLCDLHVTCSKPAVLYCDKKSALHIAANPIFHDGQSTWTLIATLFANVPLLVSRSSFPFLQLTRLLTYSPRACLPNCSPTLSPSWGC